MDQADNANIVGPQKRKYVQTMPFDSEQLPATTPSIHYQMSNDVRHKINISQWLGENANDVALQVS
jgi:hypothetical protein